jgi:hypothetical protein
MLSAQNTAKSLKQTRAGSLPRELVSYCEICGWPFHCPAEQWPRLECRACESLPR